jgi:hypothetical protein
MPVGGSFGIAEGVKVGFLYDKNVSGQMNIGVYQVKLRGFAVT